jgi:hypothetical protein
MALAVNQLVLGINSACASGWRCALLLQRRRCQTCGHRRYWLSSLTQLAQPTVQNGKWLHSTLAYQHPGAGPAKRDAPGASPQRQRIMVEPTSLTKGTLELAEYMLELGVSWLLP